MKIKLEASFRREFKYLRKKYPSLPKDLQLLGENLQLNPKQGAALGMDCYKIRMSITSKNAGKSGGARVITCVKIVNDTIHMLTIYDKSETESINDKFLKLLVEAIELDKYDE